MMPAIQTQVRRTLPLEAVDTRQRLMTTEMAVADLAAADIYGVLAAIIRRLEGLWIGAMRILEVLIL